MALSGIGISRVNVKPTDEKIELYKPKYSDWRICNYKKHDINTGELIEECTNKYRVKIYEYVGKTQVRHNGNLNHRYCSEECRHKAMLVRSSIYQKKKRDARRKSNELV